jgi:CRISPR-associated endonuclease Cas2
MAKKSRLLQILYLAEDFLIFFDDHFKSTSWVYRHSGVSRQTKIESRKYLRQKKILKSDFSLDLPDKSIYSLVAKPWDEKWRVINFDIPEKDRKLRDKLRYSLEQVGFKSLQRSLWISPLPIDDFIEKIRKNLDDPFNMVIFVGGLKGFSSKELVQRLWNLSEWSKKAENLLDKLEESGQDRKELEEEFWGLVINHPKVPLSLLPSDWPLNRLAVNFIKRINADGTDKKAL